MQSAFRLRNPDTRVRHIRAMRERASARYKVRTYGTSVKMATAAEKVRAVLTDIVERTPTQPASDSCSSRSLLMQQRGKQILESSQSVEAFEKFSSEVVAYLSTVIDDTTKRFKLNTSKRESLWAEFHQLRIYQNDKLHKLWKEVLQQLKVIDDDPLLKQSMYTDLFAVSEKLLWFSSYHKCCTITNDRTYK